MKCKKCGTDFPEGIFCPECGTKLDSEISLKEQIHMGVESEKCDCQINENTEYEATLNCETAQWESYAVIESRIYNGVIYESDEEAKRAKEENAKIDVLKEKLMETKSQKKRQEIFETFNDDICTIEAQKRYGMLKNKVYLIPPKEIMLNRIYGITILLAFVVAIFVLSQNRVNGLFGFVVIWFEFGIPIWIVWKIILFIKSKSKNHYLYIKNI